MCPNGVYSALDYPRVHAPDLARDAKISRKEAEKRLGRWVEVLLHILAKVPEVEIPYGSGIYYQKMGHKMFTVRLDRRRIAQAKKNRRRARAAYIRSARIRPVY